MNLKIQLTQGEAENLLSQLYKKNKTLNDSLESPTIIVEIVPNFYREKLQLIRFFREGVGKIIANEIEHCEGIPTLGSSKKYVENYFNIP